MENPLGQRLRELPGPMLLTGHTGFKGTWMTFLLEHLNVPVVGYSLPAEKDSLYERAERTGAIPEVFADIRNYEALESYIDLHKPSTIIHMAAQPLVLKSYESPRETFDVNVMGTVNVLDVAFKKDFIKVIVVVTTDKVYKNDNSGRAFVESDPLEGKDPYSASKVGTEAVVAAWQQIARASGGPKVVSVRAGNVIGGGDFGRDRLLPDLVRGVINQNVVEIRNPNSTRPWQHVLDPIRGYIVLAEKALEGEISSAYNFGPLENVLSVSQVVQIFLDHGVLKLENKIRSFEENPAVESIQLAIDPEKSLVELAWQPKLNSEEGIEWTADWWEKYLTRNESANKITSEQIAKYLNS